MRAVLRRAVVQRRRVRQSHQDAVGNQGDSIRTADAPRGHQARLRARSRAESDAWGEVRRGTGQERLDSRSPQDRPEDEA